MTLPLVSVGKSEKDAMSETDEITRLRGDLSYAIDALGRETVRRLAHDKFITDKGLWQEFIQTDAYRRAYNKTTQGQHDHPNS